MPGRNWFWLKDILGYRWLTWRITIEKNAKRSTKVFQKFDEEIKKYGYVHKKLYKLTIRFWKNHTKSGFWFTFKYDGYRSKHLLNQIDRVVDLYWLRNVKFYIGPTLRNTFPFFVYTCAPVYLVFISPLGIEMIIFGVNGDGLFKNYNLHNRQRLILTVIVLHSILNDYQSSKRQLFSL